jgi:hypothetical protein
MHDSKINSYETISPAILDKLLAPTYYRNNLRYQ